AAGWGISARILAARNRDRSWIEKVPLLRELYRDHLVYAGALVRTFLESYVVADKFDVIVEGDGRIVVLEGLTDLIVKNTRVYGGGWIFDRESRHDDGRFEVVPFRSKRDWSSTAIVDLDGNPVGEEVWNRFGVHRSEPFRAAQLALRFHVPPGHADL